MVVFDDSIRSQVRTSSKQTHLHALLSALAAEDPQQKTDMFDILRQTAENKSLKGMVVLISDLFVDRAGLFRGLGLLRHRGHDVLILHVMDDEEIDFNFAGTTKFEGMEEMGDLICDPRALREGYMSAVGTFLGELRQHCARNVIDFQTIRTSEHLDAALAHYLNHRIGMRQTVRN
jgi:uncharacterized protein (DUF58 family)